MHKYDKNIEILSPGGDSDSVKAAILGGANAVYLGLKKFNARKRASNIDLETFSNLIEIAHSRNVKLFVTLNILLTESEISEAVHLVAELIDRNVDAVIVQDVGFAYTLRKLFPELEIHASTQMTTHNSLQLKFLNELKVQQINFSRELSSDELKTQIDEANKLDLKTEIFVHGAYCISCSGICYMSAAISGQAGNRGACLQPCRRQYGIEENSSKDYLLSLKDNNALPHSEELFNLGADTLKIEGRIKGYNYVYNVTKSWRDSLDGFYNHSKIDLEKLNSNVAKVFNRDFSAGYFENKISSNMFINSPIDQSLKQIGIVLKYSAREQILFFENNVNIPINTRVNIYTTENLFICSAIIKKKNSKNSYSIKIENQLKGKINNGQLVLASNENAESIQIKSKIDNLKSDDKILNITVSGKINEKLIAEFECNNRRVSIESQTTLQKAQSKGLGLQTLEKQFGRLGDTRFSLGKVDIRGLENDLFIPVKELNNIRRFAISKFEKPKIEYNFKENQASAKVNRKNICVLTSDPNEAKIFCERTNSKVFLESSTHSKIDDFNDLIIPYLPAFYLERDIEFYTNFLSELKPNQVVCNNTGMGYWCSVNNQEWIAGPMLNSTNGFTFNAYKNIVNASGGFFSEEINLQQINSIAIPQNFETYYKVLGPLILMTTRQCLFLKPNLCPVNKVHTDRSCLKGCFNYTKYFDEKDIPFHIIKSKGFQNRIYNDAKLFLPEAIHQVNSHNFLLDLRVFPFLELSINQKIEIINYFEELTKGKRPDKFENKKIKGWLKSTTRGNYNRGFLEQ